MPPSGRVRRRATGWVSIALALLALAIVVPPGIATGAPTKSPTPAIASDPTAVAKADFATRAGFAGWQSADASDGAPALRPQTVDVVFHPEQRTELRATGPGPVTAAEYARADGLSPAAYASAIQYFRGEGLSVVHTWPDRLALSLRGSPAVLDRAFATSLRSGTFDGRPVVFPAAPPSLPPVIESEVSGVVGLSSGFVRFSFSLDAPRALGAAGAGPSAGSGLNSITPAMARSMYNLSQLYNLTGGPGFPSSESIALILWGAGYDPSDVQTFYAQDFPTSFPAPRIAPYPVDGAPAPSSSALSSRQPLDVEEMTLDLEWSGSVAPGATLDAVYTSAPTTGNLTDAFETALSLPNVTAISMSFGAPEATDGSLIAAWTPLFSEAAGRGITVLAATGDTGGDLNSSCRGGPAPEYPASSPEVLAVGGTVVTVHRNFLGTITGFGESAWSGGGGGFSSKYRAPGWQLVGSARTAIEAAGGGRGTPDVSATASNNFIFYAGTNQEADGTSFATPLWAGLVADLDAHVGRSLGLFTDRLYHLTANQSATPADDGIADITSGANCVDSGRPGWDAASGWGSPRGVALDVELSGSFVTLTLQESATTVAPGGSVVVRAQVANATTGAPIPGTPVLLRIQGTTTVGPCVGSFGNASVLSNGTGWVSASLSVPACYLGSHAQLSASVATDRLYGRTMTRIAVNLLGLLPALEALGNAPYSYLLYAGIVGAAVAVGGWIGRRRPPTPGAARPTLPPSVPPPASPAGPSVAPGPPARSVPPPTGR